MNLGTVGEISINLFVSHLCCNSFVCIFVGIVKASKGHHADALFCYNRALKYRKRYANCYYNMGNLYLAMNNSKLALQSWSQSLAINSKHSPSWANMLTLLDSQGTCNLRTFTI